MVHPVLFSWEKITLHYIFAWNMSALKLKLMKEVAFSTDPAFCSKCGSILPLPSEEDKVRCKACKSQQDTASELVLIL